jgi:hypothetical protein
MLTIDQLQNEEQWRQCCHRAIGRIGNRVRVIIGRVNMAMQRCDHSINRGLWLNLAASLSSREYFFFPIEISGSIKTP